MITEVPTVSPVTSPDSIPTDATTGLPLNQVPPAVASLRFMDNPVQPLASPVMPAGNGFTVTVVVVKQPSGNV